MSDSSKSRKILIRHASATPEETFRKNTKKAKQARTERPPEDFGAPEMKWGAMEEQENKMKKIRIIREQAGSKVNDAVEILNKIDFAVNPGRFPGMSAGAFDAGSGTRNAQRIVNLEDLKLSDAEIVAAIEQSNHDISKLASKITTALKKAKVGKKKVRNRDIFDRFLAMATSAEAREAGTTKSKTTFTQTVVSEPKKVPKKDSMVADKKPEGDPAVAAVQSGLIAVGIDVGKDGADGLMGPNTRRAIRQFQQQALGSSGAFGPRSARALINAIESNPGRKAMYAMTLSKLREFEKTRKTLKTSQRRTKKGKPAAPKAPEYDFTKDRPPLAMIPDEESGIGDTDTPGDEPEEAEQLRRPVERKRKPIRLGGAGKRWTIYADVAIANDGERIPTFGENSLISRLQAAQTKGAAQTQITIRNAQTRLPNAPANESFQLTVGDLKRIINEELGRLDEQPSDSAQSVAAPFVPGGPKITGTDATGRRFNVPVGDTDSGDETASKLPPGLKLIEPHTKLSSGSRSSLTRKETPQWTREEGMVFISQSKSSHGEHQFAQDPYTYTSDGDDYVVVSGPRPGAIGKTIRKDATSPRMQKAHALLDKRLGKAPEVAIGKPDPGEPEPEAKDAEGAEEITKKDEKQIKDVATATYGAIKKAIDDIRPIAEEIDSAIEGFTTDADLYIIWREVKRSIVRDDDSLFKTRLLNGLYAADYAGVIASWAMPVVIGAGAALIAAATVASGGALLPALGGVLAGLGSGAGISGTAALAGLSTMSGAATAAATAGASALSAAAFRDYLSDKLGDDPETAKALAGVGDLSLPNEAYDEVDPFTGKPAQLAMEAVRDVMTGIARGNITDKQDALNKLEAPLKAEEVLDIVEKG